MNYFQKLLFIIIVMPVLLSAQDLSGISGAFTDLGFGAKPMAMGGAFVGQADNSNAISWNPAGIVNVTNNQVAFNYFKQMSLVSYQSLSGVLPLNKTSALGIAALISGDDALREWTLYTTYSHRFSSFSIGASLKIRYASFGNNKLNDSDYLLFEPSEIAQGISNQVHGDAFGIGVDIGAMYRLSQYINLGFVVKDLASPISWNSSNENADNNPDGAYTESLPVEMVFGSSFIITKEIIVNADYSPSLYEDTGHKFNFGAEVTMLDVISIRGGMQKYIQTESFDNYGLGLGLQLGNENFRIFFDYAYLIERLGNTQRFSIKAAF